jgi:DNA-binding GntR family transcriptional regulator
MIQAPARPSRRALADWALERLYDLVFSGELPPEAELTESGLAARLNVSRSPIREALAQLEDDGLITIDPTTGRRFIARFDARDVYEVYTIRTALEAIAHRLAAEHITSDEIASIERMVEELERRVEAQAIGAPPQSKEFEPRLPIHQAVCAASGLLHLEPLLSPLWLKTRVLLTHLDRAGVYRDDDELPIVTGHYRRILEALRSHSPDEAEAALREHLFVRRDRIVAAIQRAGGVIGQG